MEQHPLDWNAKLVRFFITNSRLVWLLIIAILVGGAASLLSLRREGFPQISPKVVLVQTLYPGAASNEVESQVTKQIEAGVKDVKGLKQTSSTSQNSFSNVVVTLDESVNLDTAVQDIQSKVQAIVSELPKDAQSPKVTTFNTGGPAFILGVTKPNATALEAQKEAKALATVLEEVPGVKSAALTNERKDRVTITYRIDDLKAKGVNLTTLDQVLTAANVTLPAGSLDISRKNQSIVTLGAYASLDQIRDTIVGVNPVDQKPVAIKDIAEVATTPEAGETFNRFADATSGSLTSSAGALVSVTATDTADIISTRDAVLKKIDDSTKNGTVAANIHTVLLSDQAQSTQDQVTEIISSALGAKKNFWLLGGIQLLFLAILLFVNFRAAIVAALAIPLSLGVTFISLALAGIQLNTIVLFSLILVLGLIVDPAIVMVEAIQRYRDLNNPARESVIESGRRYGASLFMAVLTSLIVFLPFGVVSGIFGQIIKYIPLTVIPALIASYFVPIALLPLLSERLLKKQSKSTATANENESLSALARGFMALNRWILGRVWREILVLVIAIIFVGASLSLVAQGKVNIVQFSSPQDNTQLMVSGEFTKGLTFADRDKIAKQVEQVLLSENGIKQYYYFDQSRNTFSIFVELKDKKSRPTPSQKSKAIVARVKPELTAISGLSDIGASELSNGPPSSDYPIQTQLYANDSAKLEAAAKDVGSYLATVPHVTKVDDGFSNRSEPELQIALDRTKVEQAGLSSLEIGQQLKGLVDETKVAKFDNPTTQESQDIFLINSAKPTDIDALKKLPLTSRAGKTFMVADVATVKSTTAIDTIQRFNGSRFVNVRARLDDPKNLIPTQQKLDAYLTDAKIKSLGLDSRQNRGDFEDIAKSFKELGIALAVAIVLTYVVLVLQFKSFSQPAIMLFTIPLSFIGVFPALWLTHSDLGFLELLGVTILVGIVENVAIFLIDYANQLMREKDITPREAIIQASGVRFRPILLTKLVALGGLLPLAIESDFWRGLSVVIIAGIGLSGFFSLVVIPILFVWIGALRDKIHRQKQIKVETVPQPKKPVAILR